MEHQAKMFNETMANMAAMMQKMMAPPAMSPAAMSPMMPGSPYIQAMQAMMAQQAVSSPMSPQLINQMGVQSPITQQMTHQMPPTHVPMPAGVPHGRFPMSHAPPTQLAPTMTQTPPPRSIAPQPQQVFRPPAPQTAVQTPPPTTAVRFQQPAPQQLIAQQPKPSLPTPAATPTPPPAVAAPANPVAPAPAANQKPAFGSSTGGFTGFKSEGSSGPPKFVFNAGKNEEKSEPAKTGSKPFMFNLNPQISSTPVRSADPKSFVFKSPEQIDKDNEKLEADEREDEDEGTDAGPHFEPVIPLPDLVEVKTGEEDEEVLFSFRAKLFRWNDAQWKERGIGDMKILKNKEGKRRILMRREQVHKICANHFISSEMKLTPMAGKDTAWIWIAMDGSDEVDPTPKFGKCHIDEIMTS